MTHPNSKTQVPIELLRKYDRPGPRYTSYPTVPNWTEDIGKDDYESALQASAVRKDVPLSFYCHIPFCQKRCFYCGCNTTVLKTYDTAETYVDRLCRELAKTVQILDGRQRVSQLHFGGGTPTFLKISDLKNILHHFNQHFNFITDYEKAIEIDPRVTTAEHIRFLADNGFNRISLGVQDFNEKVQDAVGRIQPYDLVAKITEQGRDLRFKGINMDLIYGLPYQNETTFYQTLEKTLALRPDRVALYSFAYLPSIMPHQRQFDPTSLPPAEMKYYLFASAIEMFTSAGYQQIGMDHFALPEDELAVAQADGRLHRNFMGYTVQTTPDMVGLGMSSISYINNAFFQNYSKLSRYLEDIENDRFATYRGIKLDTDDLIRQYVIASLMCNFTLGYKQLEERFGITFSEYFKRERDLLQPFVDDGLIVISDQGIDVTRIGRTFVRNIAMTFDIYLGSDGPGKKATFSRTI